MLFLQTRKRTNADSGRKSGRERAVTRQFLRELAKEVAVFLNTSPVGDKRFIFVGLAVASVLPC